MNRIGTPLLSRHPWPPYDTIPSIWRRQIDENCPACTCCWPRALLAQRHKVNINTETPEGQALQSIGQESDDAKKLAMLEKFTEDYAKSENLPWVYTKMQPLYTKANQPDKAIEIGDKLIALDAEDMETALATLKAAEAKKDPDQVKKWSNVTGPASRKR